MIHNKMQQLSDQANLA